MFDSQLLIFMGATALLTLTPGADTLLVLRNTLGQGWQAGILTTLGISTGLLFHALVSSVGLSLVLVNSAAAFQVVKLVGALYLIFLGLQSVFFSAKTAYKEVQQDAVELSSQTASGQRIRVSFWNGLLTNILNPKVAVFYLAFLPQFVRPEDDLVFRTIFLASIHILMGVIWLSFVTFFIRCIRKVFLKARTRRILETVSGLILIGLGLRLAAEHS